MKVVVYISVFVVLFFIYSYYKRKRLESEYQSALKGSDKVEALRAGREYYRNLRAWGKLTIYDEQAITNDLNTMNSSTVVTDSNKSDSSSIDKLERLATLKSQGLLTEEEFNHLKNKEVLK